MTDFFSDAHSIVTVLSFVTFIGIVWWTYSARRANALNEAAYLPFADEEAFEHPCASTTAATVATVNANRTEKQHG